MSFRTESPFFRILCVTALMLSVQILSAEENSGGEWYRSNVIGMMLEIIPEPERDNYQWTIFSRILPPDQAGERTKISLYADGQEVWNEISTAAAGRVVITRTWPDGRVFEKQYRENLLVEEREIYPDSDEGNLSGALSAGTAELRYRYRYAGSQLLGVSMFRDEEETERTSYVRRSDGSLHMRQLTVQSGTAAGEEVLILGGVNDSRIVVGRRADFTLVRSFTGGVIVSQTWIDGRKVSPDTDVRSDQSGELIVTETRSDGERVTLVYDAAGKLSRRILSDRQGETSETYRYRNDGRLAGKETVGPQERSITEYRYDNAGRLAEETTSSEGIVLRRIIYDTAGRTEELYRSGILYLTIIYEPDGTTVKETRLAD